MPEAGQLGWIERNGALCLCHGASVDAIAAKVHTALGGDRAIQLTA